MTSYANMTLPELELEVERLHAEARGAPRATHDFANTWAGASKHWAEAASELARRKKECPSAPNPYADEPFAIEYKDAHGKLDFERMARVLSGRLDEMDKRARAANKRADEAERRLATLSHPPAQDAPGAEAIAALARGYELMQRAIWNMAGTSGPDAAWYRQQAQAVTDRVDALWKVEAGSNPSRPGDCLTQADKFLAALRASTEEGKTQ